MADKAPAEKKPVAKTVAPAKAAAPAKAGASPGGASPTTKAATTAKPGATASSATSKPAAAKGVASSAASSAKPVATKAAGKGTAPKGGAQKKKAPEPDEAANKEADTYLEEYEQPADPWAGERSRYGGRLSAAEGYDKLKEVDVTAPFVVSASQLQVAQAALDPPACSAAVGIARAVDSLVETGGTTSQRLSLSGCGLQEYQMGVGVAGKMVELDLRMNELTSIDSLAPNALRSIDLAGNHLVRPPVFKAEMPKLVRLDLSFNDLSSAVSSAGSGAFATLSSLRALALQNCMLSTLKGKDGAFLFADLPNLLKLDLSFNLIAEPSELFPVTALQRLAHLDVGCNEMCAHPDYDACKAELRRKLSTLKSLNEEAVTNNFMGYGENAVEKGDMIAAMTAAMSQDNSSCSCIEGNPCLNADNCNDWHKRFAVAHKARLENYWSQGRAFCDLR